ncbi:MAG: ferredoxin [Bacteroidetes bacterium]|nr:MAG: ferredoxin [Bacteroidota bacterium]
MTILVTIITLVTIGVIAAVILYLVAQKFKVYENPKIDEVEEALPGANCGGCGFPGCRGMAEALVKAEDLSTLFCPVGGNETMAEVAKILGKEIAAKEPMVAVVRCNGNFEKRKRTNQYDGAATCVMAASLYGGDTACEYGCLGLGDCVEACNFDAIYMDLTTGLPVVNQDNCTACGACVEACPRDIIELRKKGPKNRRIFVSCVNEDKGAVAMKACKVACIGCGKCEKVCAFGAITIENNLAYIDFEKCKLCRKCVAVCPTGAIHEINFPVKKAVAKPEEKQQIEKNKEEINKNSENK